MDPELEKRLRERILADLDEMTRHTDGTVSREQLLKRGQRDSPRCLGVRVPGNEWEEDRPPVPQS